MRIKNKYLRNKGYRSKHWNRIRNTRHPFETFCPYASGMWWDTSSEAQVERNFEWIGKDARMLESGTHKRVNASSWFRRHLNSDLRAKQRSVMNKVRQGNYDAEFPSFKKDANWLYF